MSERSQHVALTTDQKRLIERRQGKASAHSFEASRRDRLRNRIFTSSISLLQSFGHIVEENPPASFHQRDGCYCKVATQPLPTDDPATGLKIFARGVFKKKNPIDVTLGIYAVPLDPSQKKCDTLLELLGREREHRFSVFDTDDFDDSRRNHIMQPPDLQRMLGVVRAMRVYYIQNS
jgi:hypothetical protein